MERVGPYRVVGLLGVGGMGQVYLARSPGGRTVAVKVIRPDLAAKRGFRERFTREVAAARGVSGMFTAAVIDADPDADLPWMATAYVDGPSLAGVVEEQGPLRPDAVLALAAGLAEGLQAIHRAGLVHRDLKPSNVLLAADGPRIIDFGVSWVRESSRLTDAGLVVGSPGFISPEQALDREVGPASDVFSLGTVLAYAASGHDPFGPGATQALMYRLVHEPPDLWAVPPQLHHLIGACLAKEPDMRPTTAQLLDRLADSVSDGPLTADPWTTGSGSSRLRVADPSLGSLGSADPATGMHTARLPETGDRLSGAYPTTDDREASGETRRYQAGPGHPRDSGPDGPATGGPGHRAPAPRRRAWLIALVAGCVVAGAGVAIALTLFSGGQHQRPADPVTRPSGSLGPPSVSSPLANSSQARGSATRPASATPARTATHRPTSATTPAQTTPPATTGSPTSPPSGQPTPTHTTPTTPAASSSPTCVLICIG
jgi:serine/threonine protein kinase